MSVCRKYLKKFVNIKTSYNYCVKTIIPLKKTKQFYVGATAWPNYRVEDHKAEKKMGKMFLLCETPTLPITMQMEQKLIKRFIGKKYNLNKSDGGEGLTRQRNFIYILLR